MYVLLEERKTYNVTTERKKVRQIGSEEENKRYIHINIQCCDGGFKKEMVLLSKKTEVCCSVHVIKIYV